MKKGFFYEEETDRFVCRQGEYLAFQKLIYKKSTENYYRLYSRSKKQCKNCPNFSACATDLGTVRINASAYYPSFYRNSKKVGTNGVKSKTAGKSGLNNRIYQPFYGISRKHAEINAEKVSLLGK